MRILFMRITLRAARRLILSLARNDAQRAALRRGDTTTHACITGALLTYLGNGRWRVSGSKYEVEQALYMLERACRYEA